MRDRITLFISRDSAERAMTKHFAEVYTGPFAVETLEGYRITPATLRDDDTGQIDRGFKVTLHNRAGHPIGHL